jgi:Secretion system C-terminal sorting domain/SprB repeat
MININLTNLLWCCFSILLPLFANAQSPIRIENGTLAIDAANASQITYWIDTNQNNNFTDETAHTYTQPLNIEDLQLLAGDYNIWADVIDKSGTKASYADFISVLFPTMPNQLFAVVGKETEVYFDNLMLTKQLQNFSFSVECALPAQINATKWSYTPRASDVGSHNFTLQIKDKRGRVIHRTSAKLNIAPSNAGEGREINYLLFGHSYIEGFWWPYALFNTYLKEPNNPKVKSWGSKIYNQGHSNEFRTEGWAGWKWSDFVNYNTFRFIYRTNPFREQGRLDLNNYFQKHCGGKQLDYIVIHLDINDTYYYNFQNLKDIDKIYNDTVVGNSEIMLCEMRKAMPNANIVLCQSPPTARSHDDRPAYGSNNGYKCRQIQHRIVQLNQKRFGNRENEKIYLMPLQADLDRGDEFTPDETKESGSHPNDNGYAQLGLTNYAWLKNHLANNITTTPILTPVANNCSTLSATSNIWNTPKCSGESTGNANVNVQGGEPPYTFAWSDNSTKNSIESIGKGTYSVKITDKNGCTTSTNVIMTAPEAMKIQAKITDETAPGKKDGFILIAISSGTAPYTFAWNNGATTPTIANLSPTIYTVTVTDANGCKQVANAVVQDPTNTSTSQCLTANVVSDVKCQKTEGLLALKITGGSGKYTYKWSNGEVGIGFWGKMGNYTVTVTDTERQCSSTINATLKANDPIVANFKITGNMVSVTPQGGKPPYKVLWGDFNHQNAPPYSTLLNGGTYTCTVQDSEWCEIQEKFTITTNNIVTGAPNASEQTTTLIYPNPTKDNIIISSTIWQQAALYDMSGKLMTTATFAEGNVGIDMSGYISGIYFIHLKNGENIRIEKVVLRK